MNAWPYPLLADHPDFDWDILRRTLWMEARSEGRKGMEAIAGVVLNRLKKPGWWSRQKGDGVPDDTLAAVCLDPYQFSCWLPSDPNRAKGIAVTEDDAEFSLASEVARQAIASTFGDPTDGCCWYKVTTSPWPKDWGKPKEPKFVCGRHSFYDNID